MSAAVLDPVAALNVSRETTEKLHRFVALLEKWNPAINLVSRSTLSDAWTRHILDSAQLYALAPATAQRWLDLGSGGGFPGIVNAILAAELRPTSTHTLVEVDQRKSTFLRQAIQDLGLNATVLTSRIEQLPPQGADVITARALAPLPLLCSLAHPHLAPNGACLFQKGARYAAEIAEAQTSWRLDYDLHPSLTDPEAVILKLKALAHV
ncbi:MAG: methyltransferase GidB [Cereibacter sp.]|jgi:16S rRNA (guanine527-N7)-methyltransferase|nr:methyltransferase GidB [Cereibacter sp.]